MGQVVEAVYYKLPTDGDSKSIAASQSLKCGAPEEQVGKHALKSMLPHSSRALLVRVCGLRSDQSSWVRCFCPEEQDCGFLQSRFIVQFSSMILYV